MRRSFQPIPQSMSCFSQLEIRELRGGLPNSKRDYHLQRFKCPAKGDPVSALVIAHDIIFAVFLDGTHIGSYIVPFGLHAKITPLTANYGRSFKFSYLWDVEYICFNSNNNSLIIVLGDEDHNPYRKIQSLPIESIKSIRAGQTSTEYIELFNEDTEIDQWNFDIRNCRGMINNKLYNEYKVFELNRYNTLFTIPIESGYPRTFLCPGHRDMVMCNYDTTDIKIALKIYSKHHEGLRLQTEIIPRSDFDIKFIALCGSDRILLQQDGLGIDVFDASSETPQLIKSTELNAVQEPYYLEKLDMFLVSTHDRNVHVCDPQGAVKVTFNEYQMCLDHNFKYSCIKPTARISGGLFITGEQLIAISVCLSNYNNNNEWMIDYNNDNDDEDDEDHRMINVTNLVTGELLAQIRPNASNGSEFRKRVMRYPITALTYNESTGEILTGSKNGICCLWSVKFPFDMSGNSSEDDE